MNCTFRRCSVGVAAASACAGLTQAQPVAPAAPSQSAKTIAEGKPFQQPIPAAAYKIDMLAVPADATKGIHAFWMSKTEVTWEAFDTYVYRLDEVEPGNAGSPKPGADVPGGETQPAVAGGVRGPDGTTHPTKPYLPPDRGFGHEGFPAISMSKLGAAEFCIWLTKKSGKHYRLPTEQEWEYACLAGSKGPYCFGDDASKLSDYAWFADDSDDAPHAVAGKKPNAWGFYDMHGNVAEWCETPDGKGVVKGGSYQWSAEDEKATARKPPDRAWNAADPQIPKSKWWLANGPFIGFRIVCDNPNGPDAPADATKPEPGKDPKPADPGVKPAAK